jgi:hypothetical protein
MLVGWSVGWFVGWLVCPKTDYVAIPLRLGFGNNLVFSLITAAAVTLFHSIPVQGGFGIK